MKKLVSTITFFVFSFLLWGQRSIEYLDSEEELWDYIKRKERFLRLDLETHEIISIVIGLALLFIAQKLDKKKQALQIGIGCIGLIFSLPLIYLIILLTQKALSSIIIIVLIAGGFYLLFGKK